MADRNEIETTILEALYPEWHEEPFGRFDADSIAEIAEESLCEEFDVYVRENTEFRDWEEMREIAGKEYVSRKTE